jgi:hypothetical protein
MGYKMYAYAHTPNEVKVITVTSIADYRNEISEKTPVGSGVITNLGSVFKSMKSPAPFNFTWKSDKHVPKTLFTSLRYGTEFTLELRIQERDDKDNLKASFYFNFYQCKFQKARVKSGGAIKVEASYGLFRKEPD